MFKEFKKFNKVIVIGPGCSGTTLTAAIIADETGHEFVDGSFFEFSDIRKFFMILNSERPMSIQASCVGANIHKIKRPSMAVVLVRRDIDDILKSQEKTLRFDKGNGELTCCNEKWQEFRKMQYPEYSVEWREPDIVYDYWNMQKEFIVNPFEINYEDLKYHRFWIDEEERDAKFTESHQIDFDSDRFKNKCLII